MMEFDFWKRRRKEWSKGRRLNGSECQEQSKRMKAHKKVTKSRPVLNVCVVRGETLEEEIGENSHEILPKVPQTASCCCRCCCCCCNCSCCDQRQLVSSKLHIKMPPNLELASEEHSRAPLRTASKSSLKLNKTRVFLTFLLMICVQLICDSTTEQTTNSSNRHNGQANGLSKLVRLLSNKPIILAQAKAMRLVNSRKPIFKQRQEGRITIQEGSALLLRCEVEEPLYTTVWNKDLDTIMMWQENMERMNLSDRYKFIGNLDAGDYAIELKSAQLDDSGIYTCQVTPRSLDENDKMEDFAVKTNITVLPVPPMSPPQASSAYDQSLELPSGHQTAASLEFASSSTAYKSGQHQQASQLQARNIPPYWTKLTGGPGANTIQGGGHLPSPSLQPSPFISSNSPSASSSFHHASTRASSQGPLGSANGHSSSSLLSANRHHHLNSPFSSATLAFTWPYLLLALAGLLMLANVYLIYSLIKRHKENRRRELDTPPSTPPSKSSRVTVDS